MTSSIIREKGKYKKIIMETSFFVQADSTLKVNKNKLDKEDATLTYRVCITFRGLNGGLASRLIYLEFTICLIGSFLLECLRER